MKKLPQHNTIEKMRKSNHQLYFSLALFFTLICSYSFGQVNLEQGLQGQMNKQLIQENKIRSLTIFAEFNENGIEKRGGEGGKLAEIAFDERGNQIYKLTSSNHGNLPFIWYGRGSFIEIDSFDMNNQNIWNYKENIHDSRQEIMNYGVDGNLSQRIWIIDDKKLAQYDFKWENGKMIKGSASYRNETNTDVINEFDNEGRIIKHQTGNWVQTSAYEDFGDSLKTTRTSFRADTLYSTETYFTQNKNGQISYYTKKNHRNELEIEQKIQFDEMGNATYYYTNDLNNKYGSEVYPPTSYKIENTYNDKNLLIKRKFYYSREDVGSNMLTKIEHYSYSKDKLPFRMKKGSLVEREQYEEMMDR